MKNIIKNLSQFFTDNNEKILLWLVFLISIISFVFYFTHGQLNLAYGDAKSRLDIARKITDNLTPGFAQYGNIWPPLPQMIMTPLVINNFLWHSGIAGYIMNGIAFITLIYFLYKIGYLAFDNKIVGFLTAIAGLNINLIYMQTTAMSEVIFITFVTGGTYFLLKWAKQNNVMDLLTSGLFISAATFSRYEGYLVLFASIILVILISFVKLKKLKKVEGIVILFGTIAVTGILIWCLYSLLIFKDAFYWAKIYSHQNSIVTTNNTQQLTSINSVSGEQAQKGNLIGAIQTTWTSASWMNGVILTTAATLGIIVFLIDFLLKNKIKEKPYLLVLGLPIFALLFVFLTICITGFTLNEPILSLQTLLNRSSNYFTEYNIRYGMNFLPAVAIFVGYFATKGKYGKLFVILLLLTQLISTFWGPLFSIYQLPIELASTNSSSNNGNVPASNWLKNNYDKGLIMISTIPNDPEMFYMNFNYKTYIHEGTGQYWLDSIKTPQKYASWIFMSKPNPNGQDADSTTEYLKNNPNLDKYFKLVYSDNNYLIYKIKTHPQIEIRN